MKVLWLTNNPPPEACQLMNKNASPFGGWLINTSKILSNKKDFELSIVFPSLNVKNVSKFDGEKITYFAFPILKMTDTVLIKDNIYLKSILKKVKPDLVHIFGTEFPHTLAMVNACKECGIKSVINIQGLVSVIAKHYLAHLPASVQKRFTFRDFIRQSNIIQQQKKFEKRGIFETEAIQKADHIIGRTTWDKVCTTQINPKASYHFCNETLREVFYKNEWSLDNCEKHSIFLSQAAYPIKGLHFMLEALPLIIKEYPDTKLYIAGPNFISATTLKGKLKYSSYALYIKKLIEKYHLRNHVFFTGLLDEKDMCSRFLKSHTFVSPSIIENESNSLSEAKILGVPSVASYVGGVTDRIMHNFDGFLYQHDAPYMMAFYIKQIFADQQLTKSISYNARNKALEVHDKETNFNTLLNIYKEISTE
ncbi:glycosyltransferase [Aquibacillus sp. 3ASR75-11]|uniref:Glycosyltransferase n=1 Tax=Terrihalobacillus insolitus TaxID=2950438 RepID=A0A9X4AKU4_9BACI|nr:glycosyltransferase [Terrihalobacillus insolitus]MDC3423476.1 glycosyltransferase [Terrihalobacillus insolitus]